MSEIYTITSQRSDRVFIHVMRGHFISSNNHINYYVGTSDVKHNHNVSVDAAMLLAEYYNNTMTDVDTVLCLYETQTLGAYLAHELSRPNMMRPNPDGSVYVVGSEYDAAGNLIFRDNLRRMRSNDEDDTDTYWTLTTQQVNDNFKNDNYKDPYSKQTKVEAHSNVPPYIMIYGWRKTGNILCSGYWPQIVKLYI